MNEPRQDHALATKQAGPIDWLYKIAGLIMIYVLSTGPAGWLAMKVPSIEPLTTSLYLPLAVLCNHSPPVGNALLWYLEVVWKIPIDI